jgi:chaperonin GroEL
VEEGIVPGGGTALLRTAKALEGMKGLSPEQQAGVNIVRRALEEPLRQIAGNAGYEGSIVVDKVWNNSTPAWGFNAMTEKYEDLLASGVIDPAKVARCALQNAASVASLMLTTETLIAEKPKKESPAPMGGAPGMGGYGDM